MTLREGAGRDGYEVSDCEILRGCNHRAGNVPYIGVLGYLQARTYTLEIDGEIDGENEGENELERAGTIAIRDLASVSYAAVPSTAAYTFPSHPTTAGLTAIPAPCGEAIVSLPAHVSILDLDDITALDDCNSAGGFTYAFRTFTVDTEATHVFTAIMLDFGREGDWYWEIRLQNGHGTEVMRRNDDSPSSATLSMSVLLPVGDYTLRFRGPDSTAKLDIEGLAPVQPDLVPGPPTGIIATPGDRSATLSWSAPTSDGGDSITKLRIQL